MKKKHVYFAVLLMAALATGCDHKGHNHDHDHHHGHTHGGHSHDAQLQLTAYNHDYEVFAETTPFLVDTKSKITALVTRLDNFKPLEHGPITASLIVAHDTVRQTVEAPKQAGVYNFVLTPSTKGKGQLVFDIRTETGLSQVIVKEIAVYTDEHAAYHTAADAVATSSNGVAFPKATSWNVDFSTVPCRREPFGQVIRTMAKVLPTQGEEQVVTAKSSGIVVLPQKGLFEGNTVSNGQTLLQIEGSNMADNNLTVRYIEAESNYNLTKREYERKQALAEDKIVSESDLLQAKAAYETAEAIYNNLRKNFTQGRLAATAPIHGFVKQLLVRNGEYVEAGQPLVVVSQNRNLLVRADIQPKYYPVLNNIVGANFRILNNDKVYSLEELNGHLVSYGKSLETDSPLLPVVFQVNNTVDLLPGAFVEIYIKTQGHQPVISVPNVSLVEEMGNYFVYVQLTPEYFEKREVKIGQTDGVYTEIFSGLDKSERVVAKGAVLVKLTQATGTLDAHSGHVH